MFFYGNEAVMGKGRIEKGDESMKVLIAPDSFKESLPAKDVAEIIAEGLRQSLLHVEPVTCPVGDGGEGTVDAISYSLGLKETFALVTGPFGKPVEMRYVEKETMALFEVADLIGLGKIPVDQRHPLDIETRGIGELICYLINKGKKDIYIGVGGTATNDGGLGLAVGLGYQLYDREGKQLKACGQSLLKCDSIRKEKAIKIPVDVQIHILADVSNPLCGLDGATYIFGKQKGLSPTMFDKVDQAIYSFYEKNCPSVLTQAGMGAGGGLAAGLCAFAHARIVSGIETCLELIDFDSKVANADLVIVGEGRLDHQSLSGKAPIGVARRTPKGIPVIAICGSLANDLPSLPFENIVGAFSIIKHPESLDQLLKDARENLLFTARNIGNLLRIESGTEIGNSLEFDFVVPPPHS